MFADSEAQLREHVEALITTIAKLAHENFLLKRVVEREIVERVQAEGLLERVRRDRDRLRDEKKAAAA